MIAPEAVLEAAAQIAGQAHHTPVLSSSTLNHQTHYQIFFKCENFQRVGAFKFRGAFNAISRVPTSLQVLRAIMLRESRWQLSYWVCGRWW